MNSLHPIIERIPEDFPPFIGKADFDSVKFLKWNNLIHPGRDNENEIFQISDSESDFSNDVMEECTRCRIDGGAEPAKGAVVT